jgi:HNH endonuclease
MNLNDRRFKFRVTFARGRVEIPLTRGKWAIIDIQDSAKVVGYRWQARKMGPLWYAQTPARKKDGTLTSIRMHQVIMGAPPPGREVDHISSDGLDNRRCNLRWATHQQNLHYKRKRSDGKTSKAKGVWRVKYKNGRLGRWAAQIQHNGCKRHLGNFRSEQEAAAAYDRAAHAAFGEFAWLNGALAA